MYTDLVLKAKDYITYLLNKHDINEYNGYYFHNLKHSLDVFQTASYLAIKEWLDEDLKELVELAALFHDAGFIKQYDNNEELWAKIAEKFLKENNYPEDKIDLVKQTILATKLGANITNKLEAIIKDADLSNMWRDDFFDLEKALRKEIKERKWIKFTDKQRYERVSSYVLPFEFYTNTFQKERKEKLQENKKKLTELVNNVLTHLDSK